MKISYLSAFYPYKGGIAQFNGELYKVLSNSHDVKAYTFSRQYPGFLYPGKSQYVNPGDKAEKIDAKRLLDSINPITWYKTANEILKFGPELNLTKFWLPLMAPSLGTVVGKLRKRGVKVIGIMGNVIPHEQRPGDISLTKYFISKCDGFVVMADAVRDDLLKLKPDAKYLRFDHPIYEQFGGKTDKILAREKHNLPKDKKLLLFFGFIRKYKGLDIALEALAKLPEDYHLLIVGEAYDSFDFYRDIIDKNGIGDRVHKQIRYVNDEEAAEFFSAADLCVLPYRTATQSGIVSVACHFELPVVSTWAGGLKEIVGENGIGLTTSGSDTVKFSELILQFFNDTPESYIENIRKYKQKASWKNLADSIIEFYNQLD